MIKKNIIYNNSHNNSFDKWEAASSETAQSGKQ